MQTEISSRWSREKFDSIRSNASVGRCIRVCYTTSVIFVPVQCFSTLSPWHRISTYFPCDVLLNERLVELGSCSAWNPISEVNGACSERQRKFPSTSWQTIALDLVIPLCLAKSGTCSVYRHCGLRAPQVPPMVEWGMTKQSDAIEWRLFLSTWASVKKSSDETTASNGAAARLSCSSCEKLCDEYYEESVRRRWLFSPRQQL